MRAGACASSCESTIDGFEYHPSVKRVGEATAGTLQFGNIGYVVLPESKIVVQIATHYNKYDDGRFVEVKGIQPDLKVPPGVDALEYIRRSY